MHQNALSLTPVKDYEDDKLPRNCALLESPVLCRYILKLLPTTDTTSNTSQAAAPTSVPGGCDSKTNDDSGFDTPDKREAPSSQEQQPPQEDTFYVGQLTRNRLAAVCDCLTYLRYVNQGLVKSQSNDVYWEVMRLRRQMGLARLGFMPE